MVTDGLLIALDHAPLGPLPGLARIEATARELLEIGARGLVVNYGLCRRLRNVADNGADLIVRLDGNQTHRFGDWTRSPDWVLFFEADDAANMGARGVAVNLVLGGPAELESIKAVARAAAGCARAGLYLVVSAISVEGPNVPPDIRQRNLVDAVRMACELGADVVVGYGVTDPEVIRMVDEWCYVPLLAQGAPAESTSDDLVAWATACISAGAKGVCVGQAIWGNANPTQIASQLVSCLSRGNY